MRGIAEVATWPKKGDSSVVDSKENLPQQLKSGQRLVWYLRSELRREAVCSGNTIRSRLITPGTTTCAISWLRPTIWTIYRYITRPEVKSRGFQVVGQVGGLGVWKVHRWSSGKSHGEIWKGENKSWSTLIVGAWGTRRRKWNPLDLLL